MPRLLPEALAMREEEHYRPAVLGFARSGSERANPGGLLRMETRSLSSRSCFSRFEPHLTRRGWDNHDGRSSRRSPAWNGSGAHDASDEHSGAEVRAEHRPHLGAEQRTRAEDLGALSDQMHGVLG